MADVPTSLPTPQKLKVLDDKLGVIHILNAVLADGRDVYAYINVRPSMYEEYLRKVKAREKMNPADFGQILHKGFGKGPSEDVQRYMEEQYGIDPDFADKWNTLLEEEIQKQKDSR